MRLARVLSAFRDAISQVRLYAIGHQWFGSDAVVPARSEVWATANNIRASPTVKVYDERSPSSLMASDVNTSRPFPSLVLLGIVDFCCILIGLEQISVGKITNGIIWMSAGIGSGMIGYYWPQIKRIVGDRLVASGRWLQNDHGGTTDDKTAGKSALVGLSQKVAAETPALSTPITVGLTLDSAELDIAMNDPDPNPGFKCKLRVYWTNDGAETIHLGKPLWRGVAIQGDQLTAHYQLRQFQNTEKPWGDETEETDVTPGRRCRIWLGLSPALRDNAPKLLDTGELGLLTIPVSTAHGPFDVSIRPRDRGLKQWNAHAYNEQRKCIVERFMGMDHGAKEAIRILSFGRVMSAQRITDHLRQCDFPNADAVFDSLRDDIVPLVARYGNAGEFRINPALEKIVKEVIATDKKEFLAVVSRLPADQFAYKAKNEPGFEARYNAIAPKD